jgi:hypothetical protein
MATFTRTSSTADRDIIVTWAACIFHWLTLAGNDEPDKLTTLVPVSTSAHIISIVTAIIQSELTQLQDTAPPKSRYTVAIATATSTAEAAHTHGSEKLLGRDVGDLIGTSINRRRERDERGAAFWPFQSTQRLHVKKVQSQAQCAFGLIALEGLRALYAGGRCTSMY